MGKSFGHTAAMISSKEDSVTAKQRRILDADILVANSLEEIPVLLREMLQRRH